MNEKLENELAKLVEKSMQVAEKTGDFVIEQAPELLKQFILYNTIECVFIILICIIAVLVSVKICKMIQKKDDMFKNDVHPVWIFMSFHIVTLGILIQYSLDLIKLLIAPKIYIIEYFIK